MVRQQKVIDLAIFFCVGYLFKKKAWSMRRVEIAR
jgi:hypothetical protein